MNKTDEMSVMEKIQSMDFGNLDEFLDSLETLGFMEVVALRSKVLNEIQRWKACRSALDAIETLQSDDKLMKAIQNENVLSDHDFKDLNQFNAQYETNLACLTSIGQKLNEIIRTHDTEMNSTVFMTQQMLDLIRKKIQRIPEDQLNRDLEVAKLQAFVKALEDRTNFQFIFHKIDGHQIRNHKALTKMIHDDLPILRLNRKTKTIRELCRAYSEDLVYKLVEMLRKVFDDQHLYIYVFLWHLNCLRTRSVEGEAWVKVCILNLTDIYNGIYDIKFMPAENYLAQVGTILDSLRMELATVMYKPGSNISKFRTSFGLTQSKESEESDYGTQGKE